MRRGVYLRQRVVLRALINLHQNYNEPRSAKLMGGCDAVIYAIALPLSVPITFQAGIPVIDI